jgi:two-component system phosphate regulon sensor histidine kinase PhoR
MFSMRRTLTGRLLGGYALTVVAVLGLLAIVLDRTLAAEFLDNLTGSIEDQARAVRAALPEEPDALQPEVTSLGQELGVRVTVIRPDGVVIGESDRALPGIEDHSDRPEVRAALDGRIGVASRLSETVGQPFRYVALPPEGDRIVRLGLPLSIVQDRLGGIRLVVVAGTAAAALVGVGAVWLVARGLTRPLRRMTGEVARMSEGDLDARVTPDETEELALLAGTLNRMASELGARIDQAQRGRRELEQILAAMEEGVLLVNARGEVRYANPAIQRMLGNIPETLRTLAPPALQALVEECWIWGRPRQKEMETGVPVRVLQAAALPLGRAEGVLLVLRDVTASRRVEAMRRDFVADASHELKTPVASVHAAAETMERALQDDPAAAVRFAAQLRQEAGRLARIVSDLLDLSRLESEQPDLEPVRLDHVAQEEVRRIEPAARDAGVAVRIETALVTVEGSVKNLSLLVGNLLENAVRHTPKGGSVRVEVATKDDAAQITVSDTGIGIPSRDLPRVFERFYRVDRDRSRATGGTGLGLSIARHVAQQHGGRIDAESELGRGSTFRLVLPQPTETSAESAPPPSVPT